MKATDVLLGIVAVFVPPLPVWIKRGLCTADSFINIALWVLGWVPGIIHSWYIIATTSEDHQRAPSSLPSPKTLFAAWDKQVQDRWGRRPSHGRKRSH